MIDETLTLAVQTCVKDLDLDKMQRSVRVDAFADKDRILDEITALRRAALELISKADSIVADINNETGEQVPSEAFIDAVRDAVAQRLFVAGLPYNGPALTIEDLVERVTLRPDRDFDLLINTLTDELGVSLDCNASVLLGALNRQFDDTGNPFLSVFAILANSMSSKSPSKIIKMLRELELDQTRTVSTEVAEEIRRILILNKKLGARISQK